MARRCSVIYNPRARHGQLGRRMARLRPEIAAGLAAGYETAFLETAGPGNGTELVRRALNEGADLVVAIGGDGTTNEVVNGFFDGDRLRRDVPFGLLNIGTGGDTRRTLRLPSEIPAFCAMILAGKTRRIDVGFAELLGFDRRPMTRAFLNIADLGVGASVVARVNRGSKSLGGFLSFLGHTLIALWQYQPFPARIRLDEGEAEELSLVIMAIANCRYFGGGMKIAPDADPSDGLLDVVIVHDMPKARLFANLHRIYAGTHVGVPGVKVARARTVAASAVTGEMPLNLDGEQPGMLPATFRVAPGALAVCVP
ncbi:MAG: diacylglycerol kinase family protein [Acidobacteriota bacterium]